VRAAPRRVRADGAQIRDLEARVELLSGNKEEIVYEMRMMLKGASAPPGRAPARLTRAAQT
jgi:hypothetical protein